MPTFQGLVTEEQVLQLVEYVKSLGPKPAAGQNPASKPLAGQAPAARKNTPGAAPAKQ
jgi:hypothetical protein